LGARYLLGVSVIPFDVGGGAAPRDQAGHAAGYALKQAVSAPQTTPRLVLIAPTSRGPLPTILDGHRPFFALNLSVHVPRLTAPATEL
jgi:hypothetical protein